MSTVAAKRKTTAMERKESQGGLGRRRLGTITYHLRGQQWSLAWGLSLGVVGTDR